MQSYVTKIYGACIVHLYIKVLCQAARIQTSLHNRLNNGRLDLAFLAPGQLDTRVPKDLLLYTLKCCFKKRYTL